MQNEKAFWSARELKRRGWTSTLISALLPRPQYRHGRDGRSFPVWKKNDVIRAEAQEKFRAAALKGNLSPEQGRKRGHRGKTVSPSTAARTAEWLALLWGTPAVPDEPVRILAGHYHTAILSHLEAAARLGISQRQILPYFDRFLRLADRPDAAQTAAVLSHFTAAILHIPPDSPQGKQLKSRYIPCLTAAAEAALAAFAAARPGTEVMPFLTMEDFPAGQLLTHTPDYLYGVVYIPRAIRTSLSLFTSMHPKDEYPEARAMRRRFVLHIGGTNTGKTYAGFQRLKRAATGVYLAPLRLLALEAQELLLDAGVACSLTTGEEEDRQDGDTHVAATAEKLNLSQEYEVAVIDECQMIADRQRGYAWTRAILGVRAPEVHLCAAPEAKNLLLRLIEDCGDPVSVEVHERKTPLLCMTQTTDYTQVQPGDALITFSKLSVLSVAEDLRQAGKKAAIIYGALPYSTRRKQMESFLSGQAQYIVSTDAIGMGLNLPIRRIIFMESQKFDGMERRDLKPAEIQQIAGRAGRYGIYDKGYVGATQDLGAIRAGLRTAVPPLQEAVVGFSDLILQVDFDLLEVLEEWNRLPAPAPYIRMDISRYISIISKLREQGFSLSREEELRAANIPFDETDEALRELFFRYMRLYRQGSAPEQPTLPDNAASFTLPDWELYCRKLDLFFSFARAFSCPIDEDELYDCREEAAERINEILLYNLKNNIRFCADCGKALPLHHRGRICDDCYRRRRRGIPAWRASGR